VTALLVMDRYAVFFDGLVLASTLCVAVFSYGYLEKQAGRHEEYYVLLVAATLGAMVLVSSSHFAAFFLGLEILSVSLYALIAYQRDSVHGIEAGIKYLILAGVSSAFLLFGIALLYTALGTMEFGRMAVMLRESQAQPVLVLAGMALLVVGFGFKLALAPFHLWSPDVYQGAPAPVTAFIATVSKGGIFALLLRYFSMMQLPRYGSLVLLFALLAVAAMFVGNLLALREDRLKRLLAYSSIAHMGYLLVAFLAGGVQAIVAVSIYLVTYFITTLGAFGVVILLSTPDRDADAAEDFRGLAWRHPWLAGMLTVMLLSLAGIPLTAGFIGKFFVLAAGVGSGLWLLVIILVINSGIGLYYYLRVIIGLYRPATEHAPEEEIPPALHRLPTLGSIAIWVLLVLLLAIGIYPAPLLQLLAQVIAGRL
jgi:NADH-quinone oxidoreductase subunit N